MPDFRSRSWTLLTSNLLASKRVLLLSVLLSLLQSATIVPIAWLVQTAFDQTIPAGDLLALVWIGVAMVLLNVAGVLIAVVGRHIQLKLSKDSIERLRMRLFDKLYQLPRSYYDRTLRSDITDLVVTDSERLDALINSIVSQLLPSTIISIALITLLVYLNPLLTATLIVAIPPVILLHRLLQDSLRQSTNRFRVAMRQLLERVQFTLRHLDLTRIQRAEAYDLAELKLAAHQASIAGHRMALWLAAYSRIQQGLLTMTGVGVLLAGGYLVMRNDITMGSLISFYVVVGMLSSYIREAIGAIGQILAGLESLKALTGFIDLQAELPYQGKRIPERVDSLDLCGVSFAYDERTILQQIDLRLESGKITAVVGPNGSGKSTIIHLLLGFYRPTGGTLCAGGIPYDELDVAALRSHFGVVVQEPILFAGSVKNNILYGLQDVSDERLLEAARMATVDEFVQLLPEGYATQVGEQGIKLSGGQRQRLAIARALVRKPHFLILDEPTNHLDVDAIRRIAESIRQLDHAPAILLVSHDEAVIRMADEVLQLADGRLQAVAASTQRANPPLLPEGQYS